MAPSAQAGKKYFMKNQIILRGQAITVTEYSDTWYATDHYLSMELLMNIPMN